MTFEICREHSSMDNSFCVCFADWRSSAVVLQPPTSPASGPSMSDVLPSPRRQSPEEGKRPCLLQRHHRLGRRLRHCSSYDTNYETFNIRVFTEIQCYNARLMPDIPAWDYAAVGNEAGNEIHNFVDLERSKMTLSF
jgi:hypothetical protein